MGRLRGLYFAIGMLALLACLGMPGFANGAAPELFSRFPEDRVSPGQGAAALANPRGVAGNPDTGHLYVSDLENNRISEYTAWGLFVKSWGWGVADGSPEQQICGPAEPEGTPDSSLCRAGVLGNGRGQVNLPIGLAVDPTGNVYVYELGSRRVQKFSPTGDFLLMFGGDVNKTKVAASAPQAQRDRCPVDPGDLCGAGTVGGGPGQLAETVRDFIAYNPVLDAIVVGGDDRAQIFNLDGTFRKQIDFEGPLAAFDGKTVEALDIDSAGNIYLAVMGLPDIYKLNSAGEPSSPGEPGGSSFTVTDPAAVSVDTGGAVYAIEAAAFAGSRVVSYNASGDPIEGMEPSDQFASEGASDLIAIGSNMCSGSAGSNLYVVHFQFGVRSYVTAFGPPPIGCELPPANPPDILGQLATSVGVDRAAVKAKINPRFWADTTYYVEYGIGKCSQGGCGLTQPLPPGTVLTNKVVNAPLDTAGVLLGGLEFDTTYHYRFVAQSSGGGPVHGIDPDGKDGPQKPTPTEGLEGTFTTFALPDSPYSCANDAVRSGFSANLPDCRAYELVSPLNKGNTDVGLLREGRFTELNQAATSGERFTFSSLAAFGEPDGGSYISQYLASRNPTEGWGSEIISPARTTPPLDGEVALTNEHKGFTPDLCLGWLRHNSAARLTSDAVLEYPNLYRRDNCAEPPDYAAVTTEKEKPPNRPPDTYWDLALNGFSDDGTHTIYVAPDKLHEDAPLVDASELLLYERVDDQTRFVCMLPDGKAAKPCAAGTNALANVDLSSMHNAISADGARIFWTAYKAGSSFARPGALYVRLDGKESVAVSGSVTSSPAFFWTAAEDGSKAIFEIAGGEFKNNLYEFDVASETPQLIAEGVEGPLGASEDASKIYLASRKVLAPGGTEDAHNLYLYEAEEGGGSFVFIANLDGRDIGPELIRVEGPPRVIHRQPAGRWATVSADGRFAAFTSSMSPPSGYDNRDIATEEPAAEVYRYDSVSGELLCISCNPTGARPTTANLGTESEPRWTAARLPGWEMNFHSPHVLSSDGSRIFFESLEALVPGDTNGAWDVYQWEAPGKGSCSVDDATFGEDAGGCVELISSGRSPADSEFLDADPSGESAFIATQASLLGIDYGLNDVYVARVGGGFPEPEEPTDCEGEACQSPPPPPPETTPGSFSHEGPPNPKAAPRRRRCPRGKHKVRRAGKVKCVPKKRKAKARSTRRTGR